MHYLQRGSVVVVTVDQRGRLMEFPHRERHVDCVENSEYMGVQLLGKRVRLGADKHAYRRGMLGRCR